MARDEGTRSFKHGMKNQKVHDAHIRGGLGGEDTHLGAAVQHLNAPMNQTAKTTDSQRRTAYPENVLGTSQSKAAMRQGMK